MSDRNEKKKALSHAKYEHARKIKVKKLNEDAAAWNRKQKDNAKAAKKIVKQRAQEREQRSMNRSRDRKASRRAGGLF